MSLATGQRVAVIDLGSIAGCLSRSGVDGAVRSVDCRCDHRCRCTRLWTAGRPRLAG